MSEETTIARLRADLAVSQAHAKRLAKEVGEATERRGFFAELAATARAEYCELRASIGQPVEERGASTHADAVLQGQWLALGAKDRARVQRAQAFVTRLERDGIVIPSTAPVRVLDGNDDSERDEPDGDEWTEVRASDVAIGQVARVYVGDVVNWCRIETPEEHAGSCAFRCIGLEPCDLVLGALASMYVRVNDIDHTAAGCATAFTDVEQLDKPELEAIVICLRHERDDLRVQLDMANLHSVWASEITADLGTDQADGYHGGAAALAADDVLDDSRMGGEQWITPTKEEIDAWGERPWEWHHDETTTIVIGRAIWGVICHPDTVAFRPLRFPHQNLETGAIESRYMTPEHFSRCTWELQLNDFPWNTSCCERPGHSWPYSSVDHDNDNERWRPAGWPDVELSADELETSIDKGLLMPPDAGAKAVAEYDAAITKYSPDMRDLVGRIVKLEATRANEQAIAVCVDALGVTVHEMSRQLTVALDRVGRPEADWVTRAPKAIPTPGGLFGICEVTTPEDLNGIEYVEWRASTESSELQIVSAQPLRKGVGVWRPLSDVSQHIARCMFEHYRGLCDRMAKLEGVEPEDAPNPLLDGLVPVRADATHPGQWMTILNGVDATAWKRQDPISNPRDGRIALVDKCLNEWLVKPDAIVYVEPE